MLRASMRLPVSTGKPWTVLVLFWPLLTLLVFAPPVLYSQAGPDNQLTTLSPIGVPPKASTSGTAEQVVLANGSLHVNFPMLSIPQRGGWTLPLMYTYDSNMTSLVQSVDVNTTTNTSDNRDGYPVDTRSYYESYIASRKVLEPNLPRLEASNEFMGFYSSPKIGSVTQPDFAVHCITNWKFTDWSGATHAFGGILTCDTQSYPGVPPPVLISDAADGSFYRLDLSNVSDIVVTAKDGTQYHFTDITDPYKNVTQTCTSSSYNGCSTSSNVVEDIIDTRTMHMADVNGNTVSVASTYSSDTTVPPLYTLTDTIGRVFIISTAGITYYDSNQLRQQITVSTPQPGPSLEAAVSYNNASCSYKGSIGPYEKYPPPGTPPIANPVPGSSAATSIITITEPVSDTNGNARKYTLQLDAPQHLIKVTYPSGGYTRYDFQNFTADTWNGGVECPYQDWFQVVAKHACRDSAGNCTPSTEDTTTYTPTNVVSAQANNNSPYNGTVTIKDALFNAGDPHGTIETHSFATQGYQHTSALETDLVLANASGTPLKSVHTDYTPGVNYTELAFPQKITTTLNDSPNGVNSSQAFQYKVAYTLHSPPPVGGGGSGDIEVSAFLDNTTQIDSYDFGNTLLTTTTRSWKPSTAFTSPHVLDRLDTEHLYDKVAGTDQQTTLGYDNAGNVTSSTKTGAGVLTSSTTFGRYTNGYPASVTDARGNTTTLTYAESFPAGACLSASATGAYLSSIKQPNGAITTYAHNPCTGTLSSVTDPNGNVTTYNYDPLARETSASMPNGFSRSTTYNDALPNTLQLKSIATPDPDVITNTTLDGLGRTAEVVTGNAIEVDTHYDGDGRVTGTSNPGVPGGSLVYTTSTYDALGRVTQITHPDATSSTNQYAGEISVLTDESGNQRVSALNAQGLTTSVCEVAGPIPQTGESPAACTASPAGSLSGYTTSYVYDGRGNLITVNARAQSRSFVYDTFSRLTKAYNPETGTVCYGTPDANGNCTGGYDASDNLVTKTDARSRVTNFGYDSLNRLVTKWSAGAVNTNSVGLGTCFVYDGAGTTLTNAIGKLTSEWTQAGPCAQGATTPPTNGLVSLRLVTSLDPMGRVLGEQRCTRNSCSAMHSQAYTYNLTGALHSYSDGLGSTTFTQGYDGAGRLLGLSSSVIDAQHPSGLLQVLSFSAVNPMGWSKATFGNSMTATQDFDNRLRITGSTVKAGVSQ